MLRIKDLVPIMINSSFFLLIIPIQAINRIGLRVVLDVVYNHLHGSGPLDRNSVLDKVKV